MGNSKNSYSRRVSSSLSKVTTPPSTARPTKAASKPSKVIQLKLTSALLARFPHEKIPRKPSQPKSPPTSTLNPAVSSEKASTVEVKSETKTSPAPSVPEIPSVPPVDVSSKGSSAPKTGVKRELGEGVEDSSKSKSRPGPKKRQKLDNGVVDGNSTTKAGFGASGPTHKLGPKANQGAINAGLRALDRTGTPCRKWAKRGFCIKTFTGVTWEIQSWRAPKTKKFNPEGGAGEPSLPTSNSQSKDNNSSSNIGSEKSQSRPNESTNMPSSPIPAIAVPA